VIRRGLARRAVPWVSRLAPGAIVRVTVLRDGRPVEISGSKP
jgi:hypothetical protein